MVNYQTEMQRKFVKEIRDSKLGRSDWILLRHLDGADPEGFDYTAWETYRAALRDMVFAKIEIIENVAWPTRPSDPAEVNPNPTKEELGN